MADAGGVVVPVEPEPELLALPDVLLPVPSVVPRLAVSDPLGAVVPPEVAADVPLEVAGRAESVPGFELPRVPFFPQPDRPSTRAPIVAAVMSPAFFFFIVVVWLFLFYCPFKGRAKLTAPGLIVPVPSSQGRKMFARSFPAWGELSGGSNLWALEPPEKGARPIFFQISRRRAAPTGRICNQARPSYYEKLDYTVPLGAWRLICCRALFIGLWR